MARYLLSQSCMFRFIHAHTSGQRLSSRRCCGFTDSNPNVTHDRQNQRFTINLNRDGAVRCAVLKYTVRHDQQLELLSTEVPQSHRGKGVAAHLAKAALDFIVEENLKARISCWYIRKYVNENPHLGYRAYIEDE
ncbi:protein NATD1 [Danio aesculapii]|uniref:protein NATD1 n=1 Tax=Danio aesculapii TaxID=1142201 RepID=UPI0024BF8918|nr:protein NATD1 [Danio aesculapii]